MKFAGRAVVVSSTDPVPRSLRVRPGVFVMTRAEAKAVNESDSEVIRRLLLEIDAYDKGMLSKRLKEER